MRHIAPAAAESDDSRATSTGRGPLSNRESTHPDQSRLPRTIFGPRSQPADSAHPVMHQFLNRVLPQNRPKKRCRPGAEVPVLVPFSFPSIVTVFPFLHSCSPGTGRRTRAKTGPPETQRNPERTRGFWDKRCVFERLSKRRDRDSNHGYPCGYSGFQDRKADSVSDCSESNLRQIEKSIAAPIAAPNGHDLATHDNLCHLPADLGRVVETWPKLSAEARLMIMALVSAAESSPSSKLK